MITLPHAIFIYDETGNPVPVVSGSALTSGSRGFVVYGKDGNNQARNFLVDASGNLAIQNPPNLDTALSTRLADSTFTTRINTLGQKVMTGSVPVVIASDQTVIPVSDNGSSLTIDNSFIDANLSTLLTTEQFTSSVGDVTITPADYTILGRLKDINDTANTLVTQAKFTSSVGEVVAEPADYTILGRLKDIVEQLSASINTLGQKTMSGSTSVVVASDQSEYPVVQGTSASLGGAWPVRVTDGTNIMPTMDVDVRSGFTRISNGTASVAVMTGSQLPSLSDNSLLVQISPNQDPIPTTVVPATSIAGSAVGRISGLSANTFTAVRQTTYVEQTTNAQRSIVSTNANDSAAGTGARTVKITYLDETCAGPFTETVTLNGLTAVNTVNTNICFIERIDVETVGSNASNVGTLNLYTGTGATGTIFAAIGVGAIASGIGDNQTLYAHHYVPVGYKTTGYYVSVGIIAAAGGGSSTSVVRYRNPTDATSPFKLASDIVNAAQGNSASRVYYVSINLLGPAVIVGYVTPANNNSIATFSFDYADAPI